MVCLICMTTLAACQGNRTDTERIPLEVEDLKYSLLPGGARVVTGTLYNPSGRLVRHAQVQISLFDGNNRRVSSMSVTISDLSAGERKPFRQPVDLDEDVRGAKVKNVLVL